MTKRTQSQKQTWNIPLLLLALPLLFFVACVKQTQDTPTSKTEEPTANATSSTAATTATKANPTPADPAGIAAPPDVASPPAAATKTESGLASKVLHPGTGKDHPAEWDKVTVHYTGWTTDGKMFDSSKKRGQPATFPLKAVIPGWTEGLQLMVVGEQRRLWIPESLAYRGMAGRPQGMLVFDVELLSIEKGVAPPPAPSDVAAPPKEAKKTKSGLAYKVLAKGKGKVHPTAQNQVKVHYTGWTTDGKMFDSSVVRGQPATFPLQNVIPGWTEGLQLMVPGEKTRFWIPVELAYKGMPGRPAGMLVFDVELLEIVN